MRIGIYGRHPLLHPGFNSTMSFYNAAGFARLGCDVVIIYPPDSTRQATDSEVSDFHDLEASYLPKTHVKWQTIEEFFADDTSYDVGIWQSYAKDEETIFDALRKKSRLMTKNQPRLFCYDDKDDARRLQNLARKFDLIGFALNEDHRRAEVIRPLLPNPVHFAFIGRGACPELLSRVPKAAEPTIFVDMPPKPIDGTGDISLKHAWLALSKLRETYPHVKISTFGNKTAPDFVRRAKSAPFWDFYKQQISPSWIIFTFNYSTTVHNTRKVNTSTDRWMFLGQYENQVMEMHLSGGIIAAHVSDLADELIPANLRSALFHSFEDINQIHSGLCLSIESFPEISSRARSFGAEHHHYATVGERWLQALSRL
ncbi:hypothetical protein [Sediminicoccus sp. KRV36]|uniref:hypothetical protein n=1 Tax=Sediminicoccus sp. KRV36 TaxID=3133721 RepID=UPI00200F6847|nr:hypothetical protein [Sediminicoccus rosea]UPY35374.1 hypothetical protein LHU95_14200 [Sediminicoccus rosea]